MVINSVFDRIYKLMKSTLPESQLKQSKKQNPSIHLQTQTADNEACFKETFDDSRTGPVDAPSLARAQLFSHCFLAFFILPSHLCHSRPALWTRLLVIASCFNICLLVVFRAHDTMGVWGGYWGKHLFHFHPHITNLGCNWHTILGAENAWTPNLTVYVTEYVGLVYSYRYVGNYLYFIIIRI